MKKLKWMALIAVGWSGLIGCDKSAVVEEPKVENCIEATFLGLGCQYPYFSITDTTKVKGIYNDTSWYGGTFDDFSNIIEKKLPSPHRVFVGLILDGKLKNLRLEIDKKYYFEFRKTNKGERHDVFITNRTKCFPLPGPYDQIVLLDTLTSKCTRYQ